MNQRIFFRNALFLSVLFFNLSLFAQKQKQAKLNRLTFESFEELQSFLAYNPKNLMPLVSAHRGGPTKGFPENCIPTFENTLRQTHALIELDVEMTQDSVLILMHDKTLERTTTGEGKVIETCFAQIQEMKLEDNEGNKTEFKIPTFEEVLAWGVGKTVMQIDVKRNVPFENVVTAIQNAKAHHSVVVITYNMKDALKVYQLDPKLMISVSARNEEEVKQLETSGVPLDRMVAFTGTKEVDSSIYQKLHKMGISCIIGTMHNLDKKAEARGGLVYQNLIQNGGDILATDRPIAASNAISKMQRGKKKQYFKR